MIGGMFQDGAWRCLVWSGMPALPSMKGGLASFIHHFMENLTFTSCTNQIAEYA